MSKKISLKLSYQNEQFLIPNECIIGRHPACEVSVNDTSVSKQHCQIINHWLQDLGSTNGTKLNGTMLPADQKVHIKAGDVIILGDAKFTVHEEKDKVKKEQNLNRSKRFVGLKAGEKKSKGKKTKGKDVEDEKGGEPADEGKEEEDDEEDPTEQMTVEELMEHEFSNIIGHDQIKVQLKTFYKKVQLNLIREAAGKAVKKNTLYHMMFLGPPGTGKTTMANLVAKIMVKMKLIQNDNVVFVNNALDLLAGYSGQTPAKVDEKVAEAKGGVLFIDEAYSIVKDKHQKDSFGKEAIETIMKHLDPPSCVFIFAGYQEQMEGFLRVNQGLARRIPYRYVFQPYDETQLIAIMTVMATHKGESVSDDVFAKVPELLSKTTVAQRQSQNAGMIDNWLEFAMNSRDYRIDLDEARLNPAIASTLEYEDFVAGLEQVLTLVEREAPESE